MTPPRVVLNGHGARRARRGHPWIYQDDVLEAEGAPGDIVRADARSGGFCCWAAFSPAPRITLRRVSTAPEPPGEAFWRARVQSALARRGAAASAGAGCAPLLLKPFLQR